jgi:hypothetical protein
MRLLKIAQSVTKPIFVTNMYLHYFYRGIEKPKNAVYFCIINKTALGKQLPQRRKLAQSGHPVVDIPFKSKLYTRTIFLH